MWLIVYSNDLAPLTVRPIYSSSKLRTVQMMIFSLVAMIGLEKCCITSACLQWLCHSGERIMARGPLVLFLIHLVCHSMTTLATNVSHCVVLFSIASQYDLLSSKKGVCMSSCLSVTFWSLQRVSKKHCILAISYPISKKGVCMSIYLSITFWSLRRVSKKHCILAISYPIVVWRPTKG